MAETEARNYKDEVETLVAKIDNEGGLEYFLCEYGGLDMVPDLNGLLEYATLAKQHMDNFNSTLDDICEQLGVDRE